MYSEKELLALYENEFPYSIKHLYLIFKYLLRPLKQLAHFSYNFNKYGIVKNSILFFYMTKNNYDALKPVCDKLKPYSRMVTTNYNDNKSDEYLSNFIIYVLSIIMTVFHMRLLISLWLNHKFVFRLFYIQIIESIGFYYYSKYYIWQSKPRGLIISSDHSAFPRALVKAANMYSIPTFYLQHASIAENYPPLFTKYALLEGEDSKQKYQKAGESSSDIYLVGISKYDSTKDWNNSREGIKTIGVCTTRAMEKEQTEKVIKVIRSGIKDIDIVLRTHPSTETRAKYANIISDCELKFSDSKSEDVFSFLKKIDCIISGNSSILLEASLMDILPIYLRYKDVEYDKYSYVRNGVSKDAKNVEEVLKIIQGSLKKKESTREKCKYYVDTIGTEYEYNSAFLAAKIIGMKTSFNNHEPNNEN